MALLWTYSEQQAIKPISANNEPKWEQIATEVQYVKLKEMIGADFHQDIISNPTGTYNALLIAGGTYTKDGVTYTYAGLKAVLSFLFFERYIMEGDAQDTFAGFMQNDNENARHISFAQKKDIASNMRTLARNHWNDCYGFVCENSAEFPYASVKTSGKFYFI